MTKIDKFLTLILFFASLSSISSQIKIIELPLDQNQCFESNNWQNSPSRKVISINDNWTIFIPDYPDEKYQVNIPNTFQGTNTLVYERRLELSQIEIDNYKIFLKIFGLNYSVEISLNNLVIFKHQPGMAPFEVQLPADLLNSNQSNEISLKVIHQLDDEATIPLKQRFLFPVNRGGIIGGVNLEFIPKLNISDTNIQYMLNDELNAASISFTLDINDSENFFRMLKENSPNSKLQIRLDISSGEQNHSWNFRLNDKLENLQDSSSLFKAELLNPLLWSPENPNVYTAKIQLLNDDDIIDELTKTFTIFSLIKNDKSIILNGNNFSIKGVTYIPSSSSHGDLTTCEDINSDLDFIKVLGFNTVRFAKRVPSSYALKLCQEKGLFAFIEIPINSITDELAQNKEFRTRVNIFTKDFCNYYSTYSSVISVGVGSSYLSDSPFQKDFIQDITGLVAKESGKFTYASFIGIPSTQIDNLDFYGIELYSKQITDYQQKFKQAVSEIGKNNLFVSEAVYPSFNGSTSGHLNPNSFESQAKYYNDLLNSIRELQINTYFIGILKDFAGDYASFYAGFSKSNVYSVGITGEDKNNNRLTYKVIHSKLTEGPRVTIPIGDQKDDAPLLFILTSLALSVIMALLINSKRRFREDSTRALLRPYNFFADIRDHRIMSGLHSVLLMLIIAATNSLLFTIVFFFVRSNILFEKTLLSFGSQRLNETISYLAWHPTYAFIYLFFFSLAMMLLLTLVIKFASFFRKNKVYYSSIFFALIWSLLPITLLLPVELILYKVLTANSINLVVFIVISIYMLWLLQRMLKGIYVIFDARPATVYFYGLLVISLIIGGILLYYQLTESTIYHFLNAVKQYQLI